MQQPMGLWYAGAVMQAAEAPRIVEPHRPARIQFHVEVIVCLAGGRVRQDQQAAGHAQVQQQVAAFELDYQVFRAPTHALDGLSPRPFRQCARNRPAQPAIMHGQPLDAAAHQVRGNSAAGGFDFGKFRHVRSMPCQKKTHVTAGTGLHRLRPLLDLGLYAACALPDRTSVPSSGQALVLHATKWPVLADDSSLTFSRMA
jgi:hypothetical protein